jgi:sugar O-acyltransferase (sialic acid O-acetyltransferase NeuD family)
MKQPIFVYGASGHAKVVIDIIEKQGLHSVAFLVDDDPALKGARVYGYQVLGGREELLEAADQVDGGLVAIGNNRVRTAVAGWLVQKGFPLVCAVHPGAQVARGVSIAGGTVVMAGAVINSDSRIGANVIVNTRAGIDHDCTIGDGVHIAPGVTLCGTVSVGAGSFVCAGATVIPNLSIGAGALVGAGSTVIRDVPERHLVAGSPARYLKTLEAL